MEEYWQEAIEGGMYEPSNFTVNPNHSVDSSVQHPPNPKPHTTPTASVSAGPSCTAHTAFTTFTACSTIPALASRTAYRRADSGYREWTAQR